MAEDDPTRNGMKLGEVIAKLNATTAPDEESVKRRSDLAQTIADYESPKDLAFLGAVLR